MGVPTFSDMLEAAGQLFEQNRPLLPMYLHLLISALFPIYTGAHASLSRPSSAAKRVKKSKQDVEDDTDDAEEETIHKMEGLTPKDALLFPITAGIVLTGLYFAIKHYGADLINLILSVYFSLIGTYSVAKLVNDSWTTIESFVTPTYYRAGGKIWKVNNSKREVVAMGFATDRAIANRSSPFAGALGSLPLPKPLRSLAWSIRDLTKQKFAVKGFAKNFFDFKAVLTRHNVTSTLIGIAAITYSIFIGKPWWLTNLQGFAVSYGALQLMSPTTFATGSLILSGLFFYDIWAVFFTPLMVTVAKNLDVPIKLVFPRPDEPSATPGEPPVRSYSMLGLGDIVLPGLMIALALRFDLYMFYVRKQTRVSKSDDTSGKSNAQQVKKAPYTTATGYWGDRFWTAGAASGPEAKHLPAFLTTTFPKPYFHATMVGYTVGMIATLVFMSIFRHAQPALLYLVPAVLITLWGTGSVRGELKHMWEFSEALEEESESDDSSKAGNPKDATPVTETKAATVPGESKEKCKSKANSKSDQGTVFSFSVSHYKPAARKICDPVDEEPAQESDDALSKDKISHGSADSISDDAVFVSSADLEDAHNVTKRRS